MSIAKQLYHLQEIEQETELLEKDIKGIEASLAGNETLVRARADAEEKKQQVAGIKKTQHDNETEMGDLNTKIAEIEKQLYGGRVGNPKELVNIQIEIDGFKAKRSEFEAKALELIEQLDTANKDLEAAEASLARIESEWQNLKVDLAKKLETFKGHLAELKTHREQVVAAIPPDAITTYCRVKQQKGGVAVARIEQGICRGCRIQLPAREIQQSRGNHLVQCSSCGRLLYMP